MSLFQKILVPTDFSPHAAAALQVACELAKAGNAELCIVHVDDVTLYSVPDGMPVYDTYTLSRIREQAAKSLSDAKAEATKAGVRKVETLLLEGQPYREIVRAAQEQKAELVVMGTHGRRGFAHLFLGSVAERVVRSAPCPVIAVPLKEAAAAVKETA